MYRPGHAHQKEKLIAATQSHFFLKHVTGAASKVCFLFSGNHDWVGSDFVFNAGVGLAVKMKNGLKDGGVTILEQVKAAFERDWRSRYAKGLQGNKDQQGKYRNLQQEKIHMETKEENKWNYPLSL